MFFQDIQMNNGTVFSGEKRGELTHDEAIEALEGAKDVLGEFSIVQKTY